MAPLPKGVNPAPNHTTTMNAIDLLMASRPRRLLQASAPASAARAQAAPSPLLARARAELQAGAHELGGGADDNAGVGLHGGGPATAEERARRQDARRLEARLLGKRRAEERASRRRRGLEPGSSDDDADDEPSRSTVGRGKKRPRPSREEEEGEPAAAAPAAETAMGDRDAPKRDTADVAPHELSVVNPKPSEPATGADPVGTSQPKKKRKNKKKKKATVPQTGADES